MTTIIKSLRKKRYSEKWFPFAKNSEGRANHHVETHTRSYVTPDEKCTRYNIHAMYMSHAPPEAMYKQYLFYVRTPPDATAMIFGL